MLTGDMIDMLNKYLRVLTYCASRSSVDGMVYGSNLSEVSLQVSLPVRIVAREQGRRKKKINRNLISNRTAGGRCNEFAWVG